MVVQQSFPVPRLRSGNFSVESGPDLGPLPAPFEVPRVLAAAALKGVVKLKESDMSEGFPEGSATEEGEAYNPHGLYQDALEEDARYDAPEDFDVRHTSLPKIAPPHHDQGEA